MSESESEAVFLKSHTAEKFIDKISMSSFQTRDMTR